MHLDSLAKNALIGAIAVHLHGFEWHDQHPGEYPDSVTAEGFQKAAELRLHSDALFRAKSFRMLNAIEFVLTDPATVEERRKEEMSRLELYAQFHAPGLGISKQQLLDDLLTCHYD